MLRAMPKKKKKPRVKKQKSVSRSVHSSASAAQPAASENLVHHKGGGGGLMAMRNGFKKVAGTGGQAAPKGALAKTLDIALWIAVAAALGFFLYRRYF